MTLDVLTRVPALPATPPVIVPTDAEAGELAVWDITDLDGGTAPDPYVPAPDPLIYSGESCTYTIRLYVKDNSIVSHDHDGHEAWDFESVKIINDL